MNYRAHRGDIHSFTGLADYVNHFASPGDPSSFENDDRYQQEYMQMFGMMPMAGHNPQQDTQYHTYQFPKSQEGMERFLGTMIDGLQDSGSQDFINSNVYGIPLVKTTALRHGWRRVNFTRALMDKVQEEGPARIVRAYSSSGSATSQRYAIALYVEQGWLWTPQGRVHMARSLIQLSNSVAMTIQLHTLLAVAASRTKIYDYEISNNLIPDIHDIRRLIRRKADTFARFQKSEDGPVNAISDAKAELKKRGHNPNALWIPYGGKIWMKATNSLPINYNEATDAQIARNRSDAETIGSFLGIAICEIEDFSYEQARGLPFNPFRGEQAFGQYVPFFGENPNSIDITRYRTSDRDQDMFDYIRDRDVTITLKDCLEHCYVWDNPMDQSQDFGPGFHNGAKFSDGKDRGSLGNYLRNAKPLEILRDGNPELADIFGCREPNMSTNNVADRNLFRFVNIMGEIDRKYLNPDLLKLMAEKMRLLYGNAQTATTNLAPFNFDGYFKKADLSNDAVVRDVVSVLFSDVKDVKMIPVVYGASIYSDLNDNEKFEQRQGDYVSGVTKDENGNRYLSKPGELVKAYPTPVSDPYGVTASGRHYARNASDPQNVFNVIDSHGKAYPTVNSNVLTQYLYMRAMLVEEAKDEMEGYRPLTLRTIPTSKKLVNSHKYDVYEEEYHETQADEEKEEKMDIVATGHDVHTAPEIDHSKPVFDHIDTTKAGGIWKELNAKALEKITASAPASVDLYNKVSSASNNKDFRLMFGKTVNSMLDENVDHAVSFIESLNDTKTKAGKEGFGKALRDAHYKFADHMMDPIPNFTMIQKQAPSASTPSITPTGAGVKTSVAKRYNVIRQPQQEEIVEHDDSFNPSTQENKKFVATVGVFNTNFLAKQISTGARIIPLDKSYKPTKSHMDAMLNEENPSHGYEISNAQNDLKSFSIELKNVPVSTGAGVKRSDMGSKSIFNPENFKDMELDLMANIAKTSPTFLVLTALSGKSTEDEKTDFGVKSGTLNNFIVNGPNFSWNAADDTKRIEDAMSTAKKLAAEVKEPVELTSLRDVRQLRNAAFEQGNLEHEYTKIMKTQNYSSEEITDMIRRKMNEKYTPASYNISHFKKAFRDIASNLTSKQLEYLDVREYVSAVESLCLIWEDFVIKIMSVGTYFVDGDDEVTERIFKNIVENLYLEHSADTLGLKLFKLIFLDSSGMGLGSPRPTLLDAIDQVAVIARFNGYRFTVRTSLMFSLTYDAEIHMWNAILSGIKMLVKKQAVGIALFPIYNTIASTYDILEGFSEVDDYIGNSSLTSSGLLKVATKHGFALRSEMDNVPIPLGTPESFGSLHGAIKAIGLKEANELETSVSHLAKAVKSSPYIKISDTDFAYIGRVLDAFIQFTQPLRPRLSACNSAAEVTVVFNAFPDNILNIKRLYDMVANGANSFDNIIVNAMNIGAMRADPLIIPADLRVIAGRPSPRDMITEPQKEMGANTFRIDDIPIPSLELRTRILEDYRFGCFTGTKDFNTKLDFYIPSFGLLKGVYLVHNGLNINHALPPYENAVADVLVGIDQTLLSTSRYIYEILNESFGAGNYEAVVTTVRYMYIMNSSLSDKIKAVYIKRFSSMIKGLSRVNFEGFKVFKNDIVGNLESSLQPFCNFDGVHRYLDRKLSLVYLPGERWNLPDNGTVEFTDLQRRYQNLENEWNLAERRSGSSIAMKYVYGTVALFEAIYKEEVSKNLIGVRDYARNRNDVVLFSYDVVKGRFKATKDYVLEEYIQAKVHENESIKNYSKSLSLGYHATVDTIRNFTRQQNIGELIDDLIFDSDVFSCNNKKMALSYALQNGTKFYYDLYAAISRKTKSGYDADYDLMYSNDIYLDIGNKVYALMEEHEAGRDILVKAGHIEHGNTFFITRHLISSLFEFTDFGVALKTLLSKYTLFKKSFGDFFGKFKTYFNNISPNGDLYANDATRYAMLSIDDDPYNQSAINLGYDLNGVVENANRLEWTDKESIREVQRQHVFRARKRVKVFLTYPFQEGVGSAFVNVITRLLFVLKNVPLLPLFIRDYYLLVGIKMRQLFVSKLRTEYYRNLFTSMLKKIDKIGADDYRYSELEYYIAYSKTIIDPEVRKIFIRILFCRPSKGFFNFLLDSNIPFPFGFIVFRPFIKVNKVDAILGAWAGGNVGQFAVGNGNTMFNNDAIIKSYYLHYHNYLCAMIFNPEALYMLDDLWMEGFISGQNTIFHKRAHLQNMIKEQYRLPTRHVKRDDSRPSLIVALTTYNDPNLNEIVDIRGRFPAEHETGNDYHFQTTKAFYDITGFDKAPQGKRIGSPGNPVTNFVCLLTYHKKYNSKLNQMVEVTSQCYIGARHSDNMVKDVLNYPRERNINVLRDRHANTASMQLRY